MPKVLVVDDEEFNLDIISEHLTSAGFAVVSANDGDIALQKLEITPDIEVIVLDKMMPKMNGMEVVRFLKKDSRYRHIPVVMQTAAANTAQILEGVQAGVFYYLTKPYKGDLLISVVKAALEEGFKIKEIERKIKNNDALPNLIENGRFAFRTLEEAKFLAYFLSHSFPDSATAAFSLTELMVNAIEHGNLGITYAEKKKFMIEGTHLHEIERRLGLKSNSDKKVHLSIESIDHTIKIHIKDQGDGFNWEEYIIMSLERITDPNGRGIAKAQKYFSKIEYIGKGNEVICTGIKNIDSLKTISKNSESVEENKGGFFNKVRTLLQK